MNTSIFSHSRMSVSTLLKMDGENECVSILTDYNMDGNVLRSSEDESDEEPSPMVPSIPLCEVELAIAVVKQYTLLLGIANDESIRVLRTPKYAGSDSIEA